MMPGRSWKWNCIQNLRMDLSFQEKKRRFKNLILGCRDIKQTHSLIPFGPPCIENTSPPTHQSVKFVLNLLDCLKIIYQNVQISGEKGDLTYFIGYLLAGVIRSKLGSPCIPFFGFLIIEIFLAGVFATKKIRSNNKIGYIKKLFFN